MIMDYLKEDGSLDVERIRNLPLDKEEMIKHKRNIDI